LRGAHRPEHHVIPGPASVSPDWASPDHGDQQVRNAIYSTL
jgi:hypothetical protein